MSKDNNSCPLYFFHSACVPSPEGDPPVQRPGQADPRPQRLEPLLLPPHGGQHGRRQGMERRRAMHHGHRGRRAAQRGRRDAHKRVRVSRVPAQGVRGTGRLSNT